MYDVNTFQCYLSANVPEIGVNGAINQACSILIPFQHFKYVIYISRQIQFLVFGHQVRYSSTGSMYVTASKDGAIRLWDGVTANCVRSIAGAHGTVEATSANFTKDHRYHKTVLSFENMHACMHVCKDMHMQLLRYNHLHEKNLLNM